MDWLDKIDCHISVFSISTNQNSVFVYIPYISKSCKIIFWFCFKVFFAYKIIAKILFDFITLFVLTFVRKTFWFFLFVFAINRIKQNFHQQYTCKNKENNQSHHIFGISQIKFESTSSNICVNTQSKHIENSHQNYI